MRFLNQFLKFAADQFFMNKVLTVTGLREWLDHSTKAKLGWIVDAVITVDDTPYKCKDGVVANNLYEKLALKVEKKPAVSVGDCVMPVNPVCTVYGDYRNQLSVRCDDVVVATTPVRRPLHKILCRGRGPTDCVVDAVLV